MSELKEYQTALRKLLPVMLPLAVVGLVVGVVYSLTQPKAWEASTTLYVHRTSVIQPSANVYDYDGYYAQQAAQQYTDTVIGLLKSPDIANRAEAIASSSASTAILNNVKVKKVAPQLITLSVDRDSADQAKKDLTALAQAVDERSSSLNDQYGRTYKVEMVTGQPLLSQVGANLAFNALIGLVGGALVGLLFGVVLEYLRR